MTRWSNNLVLITLFGIINDTLTLAVVIKKNQFEAIKPSPLDDIHEISDKKTTTEFDPYGVTIINDNHTKREGASTIKSERKTEEEQTRIITTHDRFTDTDKSKCCGTRFESSTGRLESTQTPTRSLDFHRFSDRYGNRPDDRFNWHSSSRRPNGSSSSNSGSGVYGSSGSNTDRRFGLKPTYSNNNDAEYARPGVGNNNRPTGSRPGYGYGYGDNGAYGSQGFEMNQRPGGIHFSGNAGHPPGGNYGIYGTFGEQDEFPGVDSGSGASPVPSNIQTQKAVALKALAGVALIGAAAALAANPALIPVSAVLAGRKRRSITENTRYDFLQYPEQFIRNRNPQILTNDEVAKNFWESPDCVARFACEMQGEYVTAIQSDPKLHPEIYRQLGFPVIFSAQIMYAEA